MPAAIYRGKELPELLDRLRRRCMAKRVRWHSKKVDAFIREHYKVDLSASEIAQKLCVGRRNVTKNMVIGRARQLKLIASPAGPSASERRAPAGSASA